MVKRELKLKYKFLLLLSISLPLSSFEKREDYGFITWNFMRIFMSPFSCDLLKILGLRVFEN